MQASRWPGAHCRRSRAKVTSGTLVAGLLAATASLLPAASSARPAAQDPAPPPPSAPGAGLHAPRCEDLPKIRFSPGVFALPTGGAVIREAIEMETGSAGPRTAYCRVRGAIQAASPADPDILFQMNLPRDWNGKTVQFGGGGLNGVVIEATGPFAGAGEGVPSALSRGYMTYGGDSGHQGEGRDFYDNAQAFANYAHEAVKRTRDLAGALARAHYGRAPARNYHIGGSKGGQEALQAVQRYPADYDGVVAYYPAAQSQSLQLGWNRLWTFAYHVPGAAMDKSAQALLKASVLKACDGLDGARDGLVSNVSACSAEFRIESLACSRANMSSCLTRPQINALKAAAQPFRFAHPMPNGIRSIGPWPVFIGGDLELWLGDGEDGRQQGFYRHPAPRPEAMQSSGIPAKAWEREVLATARIFDASSPDLDAFRADGGRILMVQGTTDMLVPLAMTNAYYERLSARYGQGLGEFLRYYVAPGYGHGYGDFHLEWDSLSALDTWVETGAAPTDPVATDIAAATRGRTRPLCEYPLFPRYRGTGSLDEAASFVCARK